MADTPDDERKPPDRIYKYRSISTRLGQRALRDALRDSRLWWQSPRNFNDPFDCLPPAAFGKRPADRKIYARQAAARHMRGRPRFERRQAKRRMANMSLTEIQRTLDWRFGQMAVTCFSEIGDNLLMWSHYADQHSGVCLIFQQLWKHSVFISFPVEYREDRPVADVAKLVDSDYSFLRASALTKAKCWEYEREYRMFLSATPPGYQPFPRDALVGIILGARMKERDRALVLRAVRKYRPKLEVYQASLNPREFRLDMAPINPGR